LKSTTALSLTAKKATPRDTCDLSLVLSLQGDYDDTKGTPEDIRALRFDRGVARIHSLDGDTMTFEDFWATQHNKKPVMYPSVEAAVKLLAERAFYAGKETGYDEGLAHGWDSEDERSNQL